ADREAGEQRVDGNRGDGGRGTRNGFGCSSDRVTAGTSQYGGNYQEPMRPHSLSLLVVIACAVLPRAPAAAQVRPGIEVLLSDSIGVVAGKRVALLTNQTGAHRRGRRGAGQRGRRETPGRARRRLPAGGHAPRHDDRRAGAAGQRRARNPRASHGGPGAGVATRDVLRRYRLAVGATVAESAGSGK